MMGEQYTYLTPQAIRFEDLSELLGQRWKVICKETDTEDHHSVGDSEFVGINRPNITIAHGHDRCWSPVKVIDVHLKGTRHILELWVDYPVNVRFC